jgi:uncharacterized membrane protein YeaQ/YmgE (transglycosylase-associated protein family)
LKGAIFLTAVVVGLVVAMLARLVVPGRQTGRLLLPVILAVLGSLAATLLLALIRGYRLGALTLLAQIAGAGLASWLYTALRR